MDKINNSYDNDLRLVFEKDLPWDELSGQNILVTGATGLIGGCLVDTLMNNPEETIMFMQAVEIKKSRNVSVAMHVISISIFLFMMC